MSGQPAIQSGGALSTNTNQVSNQFQQMTSPPYSQGINPGANNSNQFQQMFSPQQAQGGKGGLPSNNNGAQYNRGIGK